MSRVYENRNLQLLELGRFLFISLSIVFAGCSTKPITKPRSEVIKEAKAAGLELPSIEQERDAFLSLERSQFEKLAKVVEQRISSNFAQDPGYRLGPQDEVEISVFDVPEMNQTVRINQAGFLALPLIGAVQAQGLTDAELKSALAKKLAAYVKNPQVLVFVKSFGSQKVSVMGAVAKPGAYSLKKDSNSLLELIGQAGGITDKAGSFVNFVPAEYSQPGATSDPEARARLALRNSLDNSGGSMNSAIEIPLDKILGTAGGIPVDIPVRGGDLIVIPEAGKVMVDGEVEKVGTYEMSRQMTVLGALASAGGITPSAKIDEVELLRDVGQNKKGRLVLDLKKIATGELQDPRLKNGDVLIVPSDSGKRMTNDTFQSITRVINVGVGGSVNLLP